MPYLKVQRHKLHFGKRAFGLKVTDEDGNRISFKTASIRSAWAFLSRWVVVGYLPYFWTEKKQTVHDILAKTLVIIDESENQEI